MTYTLFVYETSLVANYEYYIHNQTMEYENYQLLYSNYSFSYCTVYVFKDTNGFHVWAELDCGGEYYKTHVFGDRKNDARIMTTKEMGMSMGGIESITGVFPIDMFNKIEFGKYNLFGNNCRTYLVLLHKILETFPHHDKKYKNDPVTELLNVHFGVAESTDYRLLSEISFGKIRQALKGMK